MVMLLFSVPGKLAKRKGTGYFLWPELLKMNSRNKAYLQAEWAPSQRRSSRAMTQQYHLRRTGRQLEKPSYFPSEVVTRQEQNGE